MVSFTYPKNIVKEDTFASAMLVSKSGEVGFFGDVRSLYGSSSKRSFYSVLFPCSPEKPSANLDRTKSGPLEKLVEFRTKRRETYRNEIAQIMQGDFLENLKKLEDGLRIEETCSTESRPVTI